MEMRAQRGCSCGVACIGYIIINRFGLPVIGYFSVRAEAVNNNAGHAAKITVLKIYYSGRHLDGAE